MTPTSPILMHQAWLVAHRGARDEAPENTRAAFDAALNHPIDGIELDIQMTADGRLIVFHDATLYRVSGARKPVSAYRWDELSAMDFGGWWHPAFAHTPPLTLEAVLDRYADRTRLMLEIKIGKTDRKSGRWKALTDAVCERISEYRDAADAESLFVLSFDENVVSRVGRNFPSIPRVLNLPEAPVPIPKAPWSPVMGATDGPFAVCIKDSYLTESLVSRVHDIGLRIFTYACNRADQVNRALLLGVDAVMTDRPGWLTRFFGASTGRSPDRFD